MAIILLRLLRELAREKCREKKRQREIARECSMWGSPSKLLAGNLQPLLPPLRPPRVEHQSVFGPLATRQLGRHPNTVSPQRHQNQKPKMRNTHEETKRERGRAGERWSQCARRHIKIFNYHVNLRLLFLLLF